MNFTTHTLTIEKRVKAVKNEWLTAVKPMGETAITLLLFGPRFFGFMSREMKA
jgi:hypothetical protein